MKFKDMVSMSMGSLMKRKMRTILTVMGVIIGVSSIVVMMSLGLGLKKSTLEQVQENASLTTITVNESYQQDNVAEQDKKRLDDELVVQIRNMEHVVGVAPVLNYSMLAKFGAYQAYLNVIGTTHEGMKNRNIKIGKGKLPDSKTEKLELFYGNHVLYDFTNIKTNKGYYDTGTLPKIDLYKDSLFYILNVDAYQQNKSGSQQINETSNGSVGQSLQPMKIKKYQFQSSGIEAGDGETYSANSYQVFCDIDQLITVLKKEFRKKAIPGQPIRKAGKPYKTVYYSSLDVIVDDMKNVKEVNKKIADMGYEASNNVEWIESQQKSMNMIQAVLAGIGAVSMLVAAIGIANTMMMSIYERTKEIGIMKVLGCDMYNLGGMFLMEAAGIGLIGGGIGNIFSLGISVLINFMAKSKGLSSYAISYIPLWLMVVAMLFSIFVGMIAGFIPAKRAMKLSPLAAIKNE